MTGTSEDTADDDAQEREPRLAHDPSDRDELQPKGVTVGGTPDPDDPAAVAPWPPPGEEHLAEDETKSRDADELPTPSVTIGGTPDPDDPAAVAPWTPEDGEEADQG